MTKRYRIYWQPTHGLSNGAYCPGTYTNKEETEELARSCNSGNSNYQVREEQPGKRP